MDVKDNEDRRLIYQTYEGVIDMITSRNEDDFKLALSIIEENIGEETLPLLFFWKHCSNKQKQQWIEEYKESAGKAQQAVDTIGSTATRIYNYYKEQNCTDFEKAFIQKNISRFMFKVLSSYGYSYIDDMEITLKW
jgi:geranylgeranyl pyrophosphate synthase